MPPRKPLGVVSGVLKSPCASSHSSHASGQRRATAGTVATQIEQSVAVSSGRRRDRDGDGGRLERRARVAQVLVVARRRAARAGSPTTRASALSARASASRAGRAPVRAVGGPAHQRDDVGHGSSGSTIVATRRARAGAGRSVTSTPMMSRRLGDLGQQRAQAAVAEAALDRPVQARA